jgi:hypothetical protein
MLLRLTRKGSRPWRIYVDRKNVDKVVEGYRILGWEVEVY